MNKTTLVTEVANRINIPQAQAEKVINAVLENIQTTLRKGEDVTLVGFGKFGVRKRAARTVRNPQTGQQMQVAETVVPFFKPGKELKEEVASN